MLEQPLTSHRTITSTGCPAAAPAAGKRAVVSPAALCAGVPTGLKAYNCNQLSTACSCLNVPTPTRTAIVTATAQAVTISTSVTITQTVVSVTVTQTQSVSGEPYVKFLQAETNNLHRPLQRRLLLLLPLSPRPPLRQPCPISQATLIIAVPVATL